MYFGSVKFFKHLIVTVFILLCAILLFTFIYFGSKGIRLITSIDKNTEDKTVTDKIDKQGDIIQEIADGDNSGTKPMNFDEIIHSISVPEEYQEMYPDLYTSFPESFDEQSSDTIYLTFDDGPSKITEKVLDVLKKENIKATFFVTGTSDEYAKKIFNRIIHEGHTIGVHTYSHIYDDIYKDVQSYLDDFNKMYKQIYDSTGIKPEIFRFPGGSINAYNLHSHEQIASEMLRRGFIYYDWNVCCGDDSPKNKSPQTIIDTVMSEVNDRNTAIILFHDSAQKISTVKALPEIIKQLKEKGYKFDKLDNHVKSVIFSYQAN